MQNLKFSILIPTRERAHTLKACIETCLAQSYENLEIIISDNAGTPQTREVVASFDDPRIKFFRQELRVSMRQNYEFLVKQATGDYVIIIGDDDGMMPDAVASMAQFLSTKPVDVLTWPPLFYYWPNRLAKVGFIYFKYQKIFGAVSHIDLQSRLLGFLSGRVRNYIYGCAIYHGCVSRRAIEELRRVTGRVFGGHLPDVYASMAFLFCAKTMVYFDHPLTISGVSLKSIGFSFFKDVGATTPAIQPTPHQEFADEAEADTEITRKYNPNLRAAQYYAASALLSLNDSFRTQWKVNVDAWAKIVVEEASKICDLSAVIPTLDSSYELDRKIIAIVSSAPPAQKATMTNAGPQNKLKEKFNRLYTPTAIGEHDDVMTAFRTLEKLSVPSRIENSNIIQRFFSWQDLRKKSKLMKIDISA